MANKRIPLKDKLLVTERLAQGQSTRQAIVGTSIRSNQTAARIARNESHVITQRRELYLQKLEAHGLANMDNRVSILGQMVFATKTMRVTVPKDRDRFIPVDRRDYFIEVEDWPTRLKAIQYIDKLAGVASNSSGLHLNIVQQQANNGS